MPKNYERQGGKDAETGRFLWMASDVSNKRMLRREQKKGSRWKVIAGKEDDPRRRVEVRVRQDYLLFWEADIQEKVVDCISEKARQMNQSNDTTTKRKGLGRS